MNDFFKIYRDFKKEHGSELVLPLAEVVRTNNVCNRFRSRQLQIRLTFLTFFSFALTFLQSIVADSLTKNAGHFRESALLILSWLPRKLVNDFCESILFFFLLSVPGLLFAKLVFRFFFRKSNVWFPVFLREFRLASVFILAWVIFSLNVAPILVLNYVATSDLQLATTKIYMYILLGELVGVLTYMGAASLIWLERRMRAPREAVLPSLFSTIDALKVLRIGSSSSVEVVIQRLRSLARNFQRLGNKDSVSEKYLQVSWCLGLYASWMATPYRQTPTDIIDRLELIAKVLSSGNIADLLLPEFDGSKAGTTSKPRRIRMMLELLFFVALPVGTVLVLSSLNKDLIPNESMTFLLTLFFIVWSVVGVYLFVKEAVPDLFVDLLAIIKGKS